MQKSGQYTENTERKESVYLQKQLLIHPPVMPYKTVLLQDKNNTERFE